MAVPSENILSVKINGKQSHEELLTYIQEEETKKAAPIRQLDCSIVDCEEEFDHQHPLVSFIQSTSTLENVKLSCHSGSGSVCIDAFLDAISQNHSIHTVDLFQIDCSTYAVLQLMERKMKWRLYFCRFLGHPPTLNESTSNVEELIIENNDQSVMDFMASVRSWPCLRQLTIGTWQYVHLVKHIIPAAPVLQELTLHYMFFDDPDMLQSCATIVFDAPDLNWQFYYCTFYPNTMAFLETIVKSEKEKAKSTRECCLTECRFYPNAMAALEKIVKSDKARSMRVQFTFNKDNHEVLRTIMSESSCVGTLDISVEDSDTMLELLPLLRQEQPFRSTYYPRTSIGLIIDTDFSERYRKIMESVQHWTPRLKTLFLAFASYGHSIRPSLCTELVQAVRNNLHLQSVELVELDVRNGKDDDDEETKNADEACRASLERYCERNKKLHATLDEADSIPLNVWPYVFHLASRGGADMLYRQLRQNAGYTLNGGHSNPPSPTTQEMST